MAPRKRVKQPNEYIPVQPFRDFLEEHPDAGLFMHERRRNTIRNGDSYWAELSTVDMALVDTPWTLADVYGDDYEDLIVQSSTPPKKPIEEPVEATA